MLRNDIPTRPEMSQLRSVSSMLGDGYFHNAPAYSKNSVMGQFGIEFDLTGKEEDCHGQLQPDTDLGTLL